MSENHKTNSDDPVLVYATFPSPGEAERVGGALVDCGLAACVNILPGMTSIYVWQGSRQREAETVMIIKTRAALADEVVAEAKRLHPYDNPALVVIPVSGGSAEFCRWIAGQTASPVRSGA
ncbi:MAG TPA: divalent-cation tolerance protein CutA [Hyphomicrobiaceae bacterium]|nr:divalent-cation tolerance protein CutA [Hyphomicrobiaceae bacterium]